MSIRTAAIIVARSARQLREQDPAGFTDACLERAAIAEAGGYYSMASCWFKAALNPADATRCENLSVAVRRHLQPTKVT